MSWNTFEVRWSLQQALSTIRTSLNVVTETLAVREDVEECIGMVHVITWRPQAGCRIIQLHLDHIVAPERRRIAY